MGEIVKIKPKSRVQCGRQEAAGDGLLAVTSMKLRDITSSQVVVHCDMWATSQDAGAVGVAGGAGVIFPISVSQVCGLATSALQEVAWFKKRDSG